MEDDRESVAGFYIGDLVEIVGSVHDLESIDAPAESRGLLGTVTNLDPPNNYIQVEFKEEVREYTTWWYFPAYLQLIGGWKQFGK